MIDKLELIKKRWEDVAELITDPAVISDQKRYITLNREYKDLTPIVETYLEYRNTLSNLGLGKKSTGY